MSKMECTNSEEIKINKWHHVKMTTNVNKKHCLLLKSSRIQKCFDNFLKLCSYPSHPSPRYLKQLLKNRLKNKKKRNTLSQIY